ncbi:MAG TPA: hypothetical protein VG940_10220, partial [Gemmatimonadales bacterium]|nr:hypothetical protein [Gemmatimonadales bacterium]
MRRHLVLPALLLCATALQRLSAQERLTVGQISQGTITSLDPTTGEGQHYDDWRVQLRARHRYRVVMRSRAFDAFVALGRMTGGNFVMTASDD